MAALAAGRPRWLALSCLLTGVLIAYWHPEEVSEWIGAVPVPPALEGTKAALRDQLVSWGALPVPLVHPDDGSTCHFEGTVDGECSNCTYSAVHALNQHHVYPLVSALVKTAFFRYFKVNIFCDCPLWPDDSMCALRACSVCECEAGEVPALWLAAERGAPVDATKPCAATSDPACNAGDCAIEMESRVDKRLDPGVESKLRHVKGWRGVNNPWMADGDETEDYQYINLLVNPERYTGYKGEHAHRIWSAIYEQSCFSDALPACTEKRVFYRLVSGMHTSISVHLIKEYLLDEVKGLWGPNLAEFGRRFVTPEAKERVENLYFAYLFVLRAVMKAGPLLSRQTYETGMPEEDVAAEKLVHSLLNARAIKAACPVPFDEGRLWRGEEGPALKQQVQASFQNITRIMDCVGCEKCKLWGKLQTLGVATALKVLFSENGNGGGAKGSSGLSLERNEVIALINLLGRFSNSIKTYHELAGLLRTDPATKNDLARTQGALSSSAPA